jgi:hypothetical protein
MPTTKKELLNIATSTRHDVKWGVSIDLHQIGIFDVLQASLLLGSIDAIEGVRAKLEYDYQFLGVEVRGSSKERILDIFKTVRETVIGYMNADAPSPTH